MERKARRGMEVGSDKQFLLLLESHSVELDPIISHGNVVLRFDDVIERHKAGKKSTDTGRKHTSATLSDMATSVSIWTAS